MKILSKAESLREEKINAAIAYYDLLIGEGTKKHTAATEAAASQGVSVSTFSRHLKKKRNSDKNSL